VSTLTDRIRGIVRGGSAWLPLDVPDATERVGVAVPRHSDHRADPSRLSRVLGGDWSGPCFVVEREWKPTARHGAQEVREVAEQLHAAAGEARLFGGDSTCAPFAFFDVETTGLSGGAGTHVFLVGCGWFDEGGFVTRQFFMPQHAAERSLLQAVACELGRAGALVTFNGKSFDAPVLETRYLFHRLEWIGARLPHVDVLHPARRFWAGADCSLASLERQVIGSRRAGDVSGFEIPARYFQFVRTGDPGPLAKVLEHNRLDLLTLAALTSRLLHIVRLGPSAVRTACEALALGRTYARTGIDDRARDAFTRSIELSRAPAGVFDAVRADALRGLAISWRRARHYDEAARCWQQIVDMRGCPAALAREATEALAIHHEHRVRDLDAAKTFALLSLGGDAQPAWTRSVQHRLARIERKISERPPAFSSSSWRSWPLLSGSPTSAPRTSS
jgi:uncharacterized protein YprB with RNaseH-like and TPR domain